MTDDPTRSPDTDRSTLAALASGTRIGQFVSVGVVGASVETAIVAVATTLLAVEPLAAKAVGAEASISLMFLINDRWTFADEGTAGRLARRWLRSHAVRLVGLSVAFVALFLLTTQTAITLVVVGQDLWPTVANGIGIAAGMLLNYVAESLFTWRVTS